MELSVLLCSTLLAMAAPPSPEAPNETPKAARERRPAKPDKAQRAQAKKRPAVEADSELGRLTGKVQSFYEQLEDYEARFVQTYTRVALSRTSESSGTLTVKKGGKLRWAYTKPAEKLFVADGSTLWVYEPEEQQVIVDRGFSPDKLGASLAFLWGEGQLRDGFEVAIAAEHDFGDEASALELRPKRDRTFERLVLRVDPESGRVEESVLYETAGNVNRFRFFDPKLNQSLPDSKFQFVPPAGVDVIEARPS